VQSAQKGELAYCNYDYESNKSQNSDPFSLLVVSLKTKLSKNFINSIFECSLDWNSREL
jgi:hypothetical protein